ncbi:hypothetical protein BG003_010289 [Podila horticola]|nr:hypothetical protein BG003_010289 [Podila horticola]
MFDIPELDAMVVPMLDRHSLVQCSQVSKRWYKAVMPQIWKKVPKLKSSKRATFRQVVLEDYLYHQRKQQQLEQLDVAPIEELDLSVPVLTRYGGYTIDLPEALDLLKYLQPTQEDPRSDPSDPSEYDLFRRLAVHCSQRQFPKPQLFNRHFSDLALVELLADCILPWCEELAIGDFYGNINDEQTTVSTTTLRRLLSKASTKLKSLEINLYDIKDSDIPLIRPLDPDEKFQTGLTYLRLMRCGGVGSGSWNFWRWLFEGCGDVSFLIIENVSKDMLGNLVEAIGLRMPKLERLVLGDYSLLAEEDQIIRAPDNGIRFLDHELALLLLASKGAGGGKGLRSIDFGSTITLGPVSYQMLDVHMDTLEDIESRGPADHESLVRVLSTYPRLTKFAAINDSFYPSDFHYVDTPASLFVDWDDASRSFRPWPCESTLKTLYIGIAMPPETDDHYWGMHKQVYRRLARFTLLEELWLGHSPYSEHDDSEVPYQEDCLKLTLASGMELLGGLKNLRGINVDNMEHDIGALEVQWMINNWPKLMSIYGLKEDSEAYMWLKDNHSHLTKPIWYPLAYHKEEGHEDEEEDAAKDKDMEVDSD